MASLGPARPGTLTPASPRVTEWDRVAWTEGEAQRTDRLADWEFFLPMTEEQIKYDAGKQWMFVVRPTPRPSTD